MKNNIKTYVSRKFVKYPLSANIVNMQDKICSMMYEKYDDCKSKGMSDMSSYRQALAVIRV